MLFTILIVFFSIAGNVWLAIGAGIVVILHKN